MWTKRTDQPLKEYFEKASSEEKAEPGYLSLIENLGKRVDYLLGYKVYVSKAKI